MNRWKQRTIVAGVFAILTAATVCVGRLGIDVRAEMSQAAAGSLEHNDHAGLDEHEEDDAHAGHDGHGEESAHAGHQGHDDEVAAEEGHLVRAEGGALRIERRVTGMVLLNEDRLAHLAPPAPGIVRRVEKTLGDAVTAGETLAWIESSELGEAKVAYLTVANEIGCCLIDLQRAEEVHENTARFLAVLERGPELAELKDLELGSMGENRSKLVEAYAELVFTRETFEREQGLHERGITSEEEYLFAESAYKKADATFAAVCDSVAFQARRALNEEQRNRRGMELELKAAERRLYVLGLSREEVAVLKEMASAPVGPIDLAVAHACTDPNCTDCANEEGHADSDDAHDDPTDHGAHREHGGPLGLHLTPDESLSWYALRAPFDGVVIARHISIGERLGEESDPFVIADLENVWVDLTIHPRDLPFVSTGDTVAVVSEDMGHSARGRVSFVSPVVLGDTRTATARVVLDNNGNAWRPGLFVTGYLSVDESDAAVLAPKSAVQKIDGEDVVFVKDEHGVEPRPVRLGRVNSTHVEVLAGLAPGDLYVAEGAFDLKAELVTSGLDSHAGHGH